MVAAAHMSMCIQTLLTFLLTYLESALILIMCTAVELSRASIG